MRFPSLHKLHAQKYKTSLSHRFMQCSGKPGRWVIFHIPFCAVSARGATAEPPGRAASTTYFNSRPCERGDRPKIPKSRSTAISIHAPARGATPRTSDIKCKYMQFQFTPLREGRLTPLRAKKQAFVISIHAPARGATACRGLRRRISHDFNSRPCERGDAPQVYHRRGVFSFQFTPLREGRRKNCFRLPS